MRTARAGDARALAQIAESSFRATFGGANSAQDMDLHCRRSYGEAIQAGEIARTDMHTLLAEAAGRLVGFAQLRWGTAPDCVVARSPGEIQRLYVLADWHGQGLAQALMQSGIEELRRRGSDCVWLGVWEHNPRAIAFYRKFGFVALGEHVFPLGNDPQRDIVMARPLAG